MPKTWALNDAKTQFSEVVDRAQSEPQVVTKHGKNAAVVMSFDAYQDLTSEDNAWLALRPSDPVLEDDEVLFERIPSHERQIDFDD
jgi:prevent-host-death family protein